MGVPPELISRELIAVEFPPWCREGCPFIEHLNTLTLRRLGADEASDIAAISEAKDTAGEIGNIASYRHCHGHKEIRMAIAEPAEGVERHKVTRICGVGKQIVQLMGAEYSDMTIHRLQFSLPADIVRIDKPEQT